MKYEAIKDLAQRCEEHPDHQTGMISGRMIEARLSEEIDELREYIEQRTWVGLTDDDKVLINHDANFNQFMTAGEYADRVQQLTEARLKDLNT